MNSDLEDIVLKIQERIQDYLIPDKDIQQNWEDNDEIRINFDLWRPILKGDWSKQISKKDYDYNNHEDLETFLGKNRIRKSELVDMIINEINTENKKVKPYYNFNVNPNLYFLLYEELQEKMNMELIPFIKDGEIEYVKFKNGKNIRDETKYIILFHFKIWCMFLDYQELFGDEFIRDFLVGNMTIQNKFSTDKQIRYVDSCYAINDFNICVEVDEHHHKIIKDFDRLRDIEIRNKCIVLSIKLLNREDRYKMTNIYKQFIKNFCKYYYKTTDDEKKQSSAIILYLSEIKNFDYKLASLIVGVINLTLEIKLGDILNLEELGNINMSLEEIIEEYYPDYEKNHFKNGRGKMSIKKIIRNTDKLILTPSGFFAIMKNIRSKYWSRSKIFSYYQYSVNRNYIELIKEFLDDKNDKKTIIYQNLINIDELKSRGADKDKYFEILEDISDSFDPTDLEDLDEIPINPVDRFHSSIPFLVRCDNSFVDFKLLDRVFELNDIDNYDFIIGTLLEDDTRFLDCYRIISNNEYKSLIKTKSVSFIK